MAVRITNSYIIGIHSTRMGLEKQHLNTTNNNIHHQFIDILGDHGVNQIVDEPDLIVTNYHSSFRQTEITPGMSDHDIVYSEVELIPARSDQEI
jgi:hypothetical protein